MLTLVPFANDGNPEDAYLAAALTDSVRKRISVILLRPPLKPHEYAISGTLHAAQKSLRVDVKLFKPGESAPFWTRSFQRDRNQMLILQDEVTREIGAALHTNVAHVRYSTNPEAYDNFLRGRYEQAIALDDRFAAAYAELARVHSDLAAADKALALDPALPEAHFARALASPSLSAQAEGFRRAIALRPHYAEAHSELACVLIHTGPLHVALDEAAKASAFDPGNSSFQYRLAVAHLYSGQYQQAVELFNTVDRSIDPLGWYHHASWAHLELNHTTRVSYYLAEYGRLFGYDPSGLMSSMNAVLQARFNNIPQAEMAIAQTVENGGDAAHFHHVAFNIGCAYARMGRNAAAIGWLRRAVIGGLPCADLLRNEPALRGLQTDPEFRRLIADAQKRTIRNRSASTIMRLLIAVLPRPSSS